MKSIKKIQFTVKLLLLFTLTSCASYEQFKYITEEFEMPTKVFRATYNETWQAVIDVMLKYDLAYQSQEAGIIKTRWIDNTLELNFADSFGGKDSVKASKYKVIVNVVKGFRYNSEVTKVTVYKRQLVEKDFLQGQKEIRTDGIFEKTLLYRIERKLKIDQNLKKIDEQRAKEAEEQETF
jgi:hypothetical protein